MTYTKLKEYKVVWSESDTCLEQKVNKLIQEGWEPQGGICFGYIGGNNYYQAMIRHETEYVSTGPR